MIFPIVFAIGIGLLLKSAVQTPQTPGLSRRVEPLENTSARHVDLTPYLTEFSRLVSDGHKPSQWLVSGAIEEAYNRGNLKLVREISNGYADSDDEITNAVVFGKCKEKENSKEIKGEEKETPNLERTEFKIEKTSSPIEGLPDDDWRMFVHSSLAEAPSFDSPNSVGAFRQNKKRLVKLGIEDVGDIVKQYDAFEKEISQLMVESKKLVANHVALPVSVDGEDVPVTLSGLLAVLRCAGTSNAEKWLTSEEERRKFPNTTESFKRSNGCF